MARLAVLLALVAGAAAVKVTPVEKVITLMTNMKNEVAAEGEAEATTYGKFACFCKENSKKKSDNVISLNDKIELLSSDIGEKTQEKKDDASELTERTGNQEQLSKDLDEHNARCAKEKAEYETEIADLNKAVSSLQGAIKSMKQSGGAAPASLVEVKRSVMVVSKMVSAASIAALQKVDPENAGYQYHSNDIVELCQSLLAEFKTSQSDVNSEWDKTDKACTATRKSLKDEMASNKRAMNNLRKNIETLAKKIAEDRETLVTSVSELKDDQLYLKDLTARCEARANDYDQRSQMRDGELGALTQAIDIISNRVSSADKEVNARAMLVQVKKGKAVSFLQTAKQHSGSFLARDTLDMSLEAKKNRALTMLRNQGRQIGSLAISAMAARAAADPFKKVKGLIQGLIERLLEESANEATKKGFCDEALGKAKHDREARFAEANDLNREIKGLEAKEDELTEEIATLTKDLTNENKDLKDATTDRDAEKADNLKSISVAKEGLDAVSEALLMLKSFYSQAAKAASFIQASPLDEEAGSTAGFKGNYQGAQGGMKAVFSLLEVIQSDFDRTVRKTEEAEHTSHRAYVELMQAAKSSIGGKGTKKELDEQDLKSTKTAIETKTADLQDTTDLLDQALKELEKLKPTCVDTGMSYEERVEKREQEMKALKVALCILDTDKVESMCA